MHVPSNPALSERIDRLTEAIGGAAAWLTAVMVVGECAIMLLRYTLGIGSVWLSESILYEHAALFMLTAAWTLRQDGHVRVDVFYAGASRRTKAMVDLAGTLFLLWPFTIAILILSMPYVARSWAVLERSREASGLPAVFLLKTLIPAFALLLALQGLAQAIRAVHVLRASGRRD